MGPVLDGIHSALNSVADSFSCHRLRSHTMATFMRLLDDGFDFLKRQRLVNSDFRIIFGDAKSKIYINLDQIGSVEDLLTRRRPDLGERVRGRPGRAFSSDPVRRSVKKRFRQRPTISRRLSWRAAIWSFFNASAAKKIILARWT
jgi:hypothetical protein